MKYRAISPRTRSMVLASVIAVAMVPTLLTGCSGSTSSDGKGGLTDASLQLNWITNATWAGSYLADEKGYYKDEGLKVTIQTGGPNVDFMAALSSGQALVAFAGFTEPATLNQKGGDFEIVGTMYQKSPLSFISKAGSGIEKPSDLEGKRVGISTTALSVWNQFSKTADIDTSKVKIVPITTGPDPLVAGDIDAYLGFSNEGPAALAKLGVDSTYFLLQDYGYGYYVNVYTVRKQDLKDPTKRTLIKGLLKADLQGQLQAIKDPSAAGKITVDRYGDSLGLDVASETRAAKDAIPLFYSPTSEKKGIGYMGGDEMTLAMTTLNSILGTHLPLDGKGYVDMSLLDEIHKEDPSFGELPPLTNG